MDNNQKPYNVLLDINRFLPNSVDHPNILELLYEESEHMTTNTFEDFLALPLNENYKKNKEEQLSNKVLETITLVVEGTEGVILPKIPQIENSE